MARTRERDTWSVGGMVFALAVVVFVVVATRGIALLVAAAAGGVWYLIRRRRTRLQREEEVRQRELARAIAEDLDNLLIISPSSFEAAVGAVLEHYGYRVEHVGRSRDRGVDLLATREQAVTVVQCKQYALHRTVGSPEVRNLAGARAQAGARHAILVTTTRFTAEAIIASRALDVELVDGVRLTSWARQARGGGRPGERG